MESTHSPLVRLRPTDLSASLTGLRLVAPIKAFLICEKVASSNQLLLYYSPEVRVAFRYGESWSIRARGLIQIRMVDLM